MRRVVFGLCVALGGGGCGAQEGEVVREAVVPVRADPTASELIAGTPGGGLVEWVEEIRAGTVGLEEAAAADVVAAQRAALDLYVGRQEFLELYYGLNGRLAGGTAPALGHAVMETETLFHELLQLLTASPVDTSSVRAKRDALHVQLDRVVAEAKRAEVPLIPPGNPAR